MASSTPSCPVVHKSTAASQSELQHWQRLLEVMSCTVLPVIDGSWP